MTQRQLPLTDSKESQSARLRRILSGNIPGVQTAARYFDEAEHERLTRLHEGDPGQLGTCIGIKHRSNGGAVSF